MLAYLFWHRPWEGAETAAYEEAQRRFHERLEVPSACFRLAALPFGSGGGYEDWYLVEGWERLGVLNEAAVDATRGPSHDRAASMTGAGWGGLYAHLRGATEVPAGVRWEEKPLGQPSQEFVGALPEGAVWRRQLVLGPAPEFCLATSVSPGRERVWPT